MKKALIYTSLASQILLFNRHNIKILKDLGYQIEVACNFDDRSSISDEQIVLLKQYLKDMNIKYYHLPIPRDPYDLKNIFKAYKMSRKLFSENNYELVHCHSPVGGFICRLAARKVDTKVIYTAHGFHFFKGAPKRNWLLFWAAEKIASYYTDVLITINKEDYNNAARSLNAKTIEYIPGIGIDLDKFSPASFDEKMSLRKQYGFDANDFILFFAGELNDNKNQIMLIKTVDILTSKIPDVKLILAGVGPNRNKYEEIIKEKKLNKNIYLLGYRNDIKELNQISDVGVSSSYREGLPVNVMEAMATGLPVVLTNCRGNRDLAVNHVNGFIVPIDDVKAMFDAIYAIYKDSEMRAQFGEASLQIIQDYSIEKINKLMRHIYMHVVDEKGEKKK